MTMIASRDPEVSILVRVLANGQHDLPPDVAQYLLGLGFSQRDRDRMNDLAVRKQSDDLSEEEKEELIAFARAGTVLSSLKSKARRVLKIKPKGRRPF